MLKWRISHNCVHIAFMCLTHAVGQSQAAEAGPGFTEERPSATRRHQRPHVSPQPAISQPPPSPPGGATSPTAAAAGRIAAVPTAGARRVGPVPAPGHVRRRRRRGLQRAGRRRDADRRAPGLDAADRGRRRLQPSDGGVRRRPKQRRGAGGDARTHRPRRTCISRRVLLHADGSVRCRTCFL